MTPALPARAECLPNLDALVTEDGAPVDRIFTEKQYRLLTAPLYCSWPGPGEGRSFLILTNVGWFFQDKEPPIVPDCLLSLDVTCPENLHVKEGHSYFQWLVGKPPEVTVEIVSDKRGGEDSLKMKQYARLKVSYYVIFDPDELLGGGVLRIFELLRGKFRPLESGYLEEVGLGLTLWEGPFEGHTDTWLRWCDRDGKVLPTPEERVRELEEALKRRQTRNGKRK